MAVLRTVISLAAAAMLIQLTMAANYTVGGSNGGWDTTSNPQSWASSQSFLVGDNLIFQYTTNHDVLEVSKADHDSCQSSNPIRSYTGGNTVIPLSSPGKRYFICGTIGHCSQGMKVEIDTLATSSPPSPSASPATPPTSPVTPATRPASPVTPTSSPAPEISPRSPARSPKSAPEVSPSSPSDSPSSSPPPSSDVPTTSLPPSGSSLQPSPSSATKSGFKTTLTVGFSLGMLMLLAL